MKHYVRLILYALVLTTWLGGCTPTPMETKPADARALVESLVFVKAKNGLCYGVTTVERVSSNAIVAVNQLIVLVDCKSLNN